MTTVVYDIKRQLIGCDTGATITDLITTSAGASKMRIVPAEGSIGAKLYLFSGDIRSANHLISVIRDVELQKGNTMLMFGETPEDIDVSMLEFSLDDDSASVLLYSNSYTPIEVAEQDIYTSGTGAHIAVGAWAAGATMEEVLNICKKYDPYTNGETLIFDLHKKELKHGHEFAGDALNFTRSESKTANPKKRNKRVKK